MGFVSEYVGPVADPPCGKLDAVRFDPQTGALSFTAKLTQGLTSKGPSRDLDEFAGVMTETTIAGTLRKRLVRDDGPEIANTETIRLTRNDTGAAPDSYDVWLATVLQGPTGYPSLGR